MSVKAYVSKYITNYTPTSPLTVSNWPQLKQTELADPEFGMPKFTCYLAFTSLQCIVKSYNGLNFIGVAKELALMLNHSMAGVLKEVA